MDKLKKGYVPYMGQVDVEPWSQKKYATELFLFQENAKEISLRLDGHLV